MLKGTTRIELTDVHTGKKQIIEKDNMVTNGIGKLFQPVLGHLTNDSTLRTYINAHESLLGGMLLFDTALEANAEKFYPAAGSTVTGCAVYNVVNTGTDILRGSYNMTESIYDSVNKKMTYVYDFNTSQGNGTIASVCLTCANAGYGIYCNSDYHNNTASLLYSPWASNFGLLRNSKDRNTVVVIGTDEYLFAIDPTNDILYYFKIPDTTHIEIVKRRYGLKTYSIFSNTNPIIETVSKTVSTAFSNNIFYNFDRNANALYIYNGPSDINVGANYYITKVDFSTWNITQYTMTNTANIALSMSSSASQYVCNGYIYSYSNYNLYKTQIGNSANVSIFTVTDQSFYPSAAVFDLNGYIYYQNTSRSDSGQPTTYVWLADTSSKKIKRASQGYITYFGGTSSWRYNRSAPVATPIINVDWLYYFSNATYTGNGIYGMCSSFLATINNLTEPVTKTADKTMKVTYIIQEVTT